MTTPSKSVSTQVLRIVSSALRAPIGNSASPKKIYAVCLIAALLLGSGCATTTVSNIPVGTIPQAEPPSAQEVTTTRALISKHLGEEQGYRVHKRGKQQKRVQRIVDRLSRAAGARNFSYPVYIVDAGNKVNALAVNGNSIVLYKAFLNKMRSDDELASVLAHEIAHIIAMHSQDTTTEERRQSVQSGGAALGLLVSIAASVAGAPEMSNMAGSLTQTVTTVVGEGAIVKAYDRAMEREADHVGLMIMAKAGYDPQAAVDLWKRSNVIFGKSNQNDFFSTHPSERNRAEQLSKIMPLARGYYVAAQKKGG